MSIEDKYLSEAVRTGISNDKRYKDLMTLAKEMAVLGDDIFELMAFNQQYLNIDVLESKKEDLYKIRKRAKTQEFKNIVDEFISYIEDISEGYQDIDTSREGT